MAATVPLTDVLGDFKDAYELAGRSTHTVFSIERAVAGLAFTMTAAGLEPAIENVTRAVVTAVPGR